MQTKEISIAQKNLVPISRQAAAEGIVLLENKNAALPLNKGERISLFGRCQVDTYRSGTGSGGAVNVPYAVNAVQGFRKNPGIELNEALVGIYEQWIAKHPFDDGGGGWAAEPWFQEEMPLTHDIVKQAATNSDKALVFIGRTAGEDQDNVDEVGSYRLTDKELTMIELANTYFGQVIIVLNVTNIMDMSWLNTVKNKQSISAVLYCWAAGMEGGHALADILSGELSPSGRLTDSIAYQLSDYPSSVNFGNKSYNLYAEDIYVGYRYFETFNQAAVQYEFGAGLSYTEFSRELLAYTVKGTGINQVLNFNIIVENTGLKYSSKEVIQIYVAAPQGAIGKPSRVLVGFAKTTMLKPGENEIVQISIDINRLASYDDSGATGHCNSFVLEEGCYQFYLGASVRHAQLISATLILEQLLIIEQLTEALAPVKIFDRLKPGTRSENGLYQATYEPVPQRVTSIADRIQANMPPSYPITGDQGIRLIDVKEDRASLQDFVAQMNNEQLATITRGEGMCSPKVTPGTAAAFGGVCNSLFNLGIPVVAASDGPSGIRLDSGHEATQVPIGTLLGCTWNSELNERLFHLVGQELVANQIDTLLGPGINIHRHPLNGRNFEYFSEDPLLTGIIGVAQTRGLKKAGVSGTIKHFVANDQEIGRFDIDSVVSQRALREIHLKPFEIVVKEGQASSMMTSYNPVNGHWSASNYDLNTTILRDQWGYTGIVMTDWWAKMNDPVEAGEEAKTFTSFMIRSQNDLYMVVDNDGAQSNSMGDDTLEALENNSLSIGELQRSVMNICRFIIEAPVMKRPLEIYDPLKAFTANSDISDENALGIENVIKLNCKTNTSMVIEVSDEGIYQCSSLIRYDRDSLSQSTCRLSFNGIYSMSFSVNGTNGKLINVEGLKVKLDRGLHQLNLDFMQSGLEIDQLIFTKV
jgi:beta-glucosidase